MGRTAHTSPVAPLPSCLSILLWNWRRAAMALIFKSQNSYVTYLSNELIHGYLVYRIVSIIQKLPSSSLPFSSSSSSSQSCPSNEQLRDVCVGIFLELES